MMTKKICRWSQKCCNHNRKILGAMVLNFWDPALMHFMGSGVLGLRGPFSGGARNVFQTLRAITTNQFPLQKAKTIRKTAPRIHASRNVVANRRCFNFWKSKSHIGIKFFKKIRPAASCKHNKESNTFWTHFYLKLEEQPKMLNWPDDIFGTILHHWKHHS